MSNQIQVQDNENAQQKILVDTLKQLSDTIQAFIQKLSLPNANDCILKSFQNRPDFFDEPKKSQPTV